MCYFIKYLLFYHKNLLHFNLFPNPLFLRSVYSKSKNPKGFYVTSHQEYRYKMVLVNSVGFVAIAIILCANLCSGKNVYDDIDANGPEGESTHSVITGVFSFSFFQININEITFV